MSNEIVLFQKWVVGTMSKALEQFIKDIQTEETQLVHQRIDVPK